jgi:hypothetical protein
MFVGFSTDGATWVDASGYSNAVSISDGGRETGEVFTFDGDTPILKAGKRAALTITVTGVYTETAAHLFTVANTAYTAGSALYVRWSPGGGDSGDVGYTSSAGIVTNAIYPSGEADSADAILFEVEVKCASVTKAAIGTAGW